MSTADHNLNVLAHVDALESRLQDAVHNDFSALDIPGPYLEFPKDATYGDVCSPVAMKIAKRIGRPPKEIADALCATLADTSSPAFGAPSVALPGYLNFYFTKEFLSTFARELGGNPDCLQPRTGNGRIVVTDISHPNVAKPMGAHHMLSTVIGDSINRILVYAGYRVVRDNYLGDWGTQFGKLIYAYKAWGDKDAILKDPIPELLKLYVRFHEEAETDKSLEDKGRLEFRHLEMGDGENRALWQWVVDLSMQEFKKIWDALGVEFDVIHGESFYEEKMQAIIRRGMEKNVFTKGERGALICEFPGEEMPPAVVRKADGATLYATRDLARIQYWEKEWHPDIMVNVVDVAQALYFRQLFSMAGKLALTDARNIHVEFGRMRFPDRRMSTRKGNIIMLEEVMEEAVRRARKIVEEKNPALSEGSKAEVAHAVGVGAIRFAVLFQNRETDTTFTWEKMLSLEGESAPYLQYAYARARSILRKAREDGYTRSSYAYQEPAEYALARLLPLFPHRVVQSIEHFQPSVLARYLAKLGSAFNAFYAAVPVLNADEAARAGRLRLVESVSVILKTGLGLLGVNVMEEM